MDFAGSVTAAFNDLGKLNYSGFQWTWQAHLQRFSMDVKGSFTAVSMDLAGTLSVVFTEFISKGQIYKKKNNLKDPLTK